MLAPVVVDLPRDVGARVAQVVLAACNDALANGVCLSEAAAGDESPRALAVARAADRRVAAPAIDAEAANVEAADAFAAGKRAGREPGETPGSWDEGVERDARVGWEGDMGSAGAGVGRSDRGPASARRGRERALSRRRGCWWEVGGSGYDVAGGAPRVEGWERARAPSRRRGRWHRLGANGARERGDVWVVGYVLPDEPVPPWVALSPPGGSGFARETGGAERNVRPNEVVILLMLA